MAKSPRVLPLTTVLVALYGLPHLLRAEPLSASQEGSEAVFVEMTMVEVPAEVARKFGLAERFSDLGLVLSDAEAAKLIESGQSAAGCNVVRVPRVRTSIGRSTVLGGAISGRSVACVVLPESAASDGQIGLRIAMVPAVRSPVEIAAGDHAALFALSRVSATAQLNKGESIMLGGWKTGKDGAGTLVLIVKPQAAAGPSTTLAEHSRSSTMSLTKVVDPRIGVQKEEAERLGAMPKVPTEQKQAVAAASARPSAPAALPAIGPHHEKDSRQVLIALKLVEVDEGKLARLGFGFATFSPCGGVSPKADEGRVPAMAILCGFDKLPDVIEALCKERLARVLSEPTLVTASGRPASLRVGGEIPLWSLGSDGQPAERLEPYGTSVDVVPHLTDSGNVRLEMRFEYSEVDRSQKVAVAAGKENPVIRRSCIGTAWEAKPGQTVAVAQHSSPASPDAKDARGPTILMLVTPRIVNSTANLPSPDKPRARIADAVR